LPVDQQASLGHRNTRWVERARNRDIWIVGDDLRFLSGKGNCAGREARVALVTAVLAPPQHANNGRKDRRQHRDASQRERTNSFGWRELGAVWLHVWFVVGHRTRRDLDA